MANLNRNKILSVRKMNKTKANDVREYMSNIAAIVCLD